MRMSSWILSLCFLFTSSSQAVDPTPAAAQVLWDSWYTVTLAGKTPYGYYHDRVEKKDGKIAFKNEFWKKEEGFINEEKLVVFAEDNLALSPLLFNFQSSYRNTKIDIDGNVKDNKLAVKARKDGKDLEPTTRTLAKGVFFSSLFPVWIGKRLPDVKPGKLTSFSTILEDNLEKKYAPVAGNFRLEKADDFATKNKAQKFAVTYQDRKSTWYLAANGETIKIEMHDQNAVVEKSTEALARKFLISNEGL